MTGPANAVVVVGSLHCDVMVEAKRLPALGETLPGQRWFPKFGGKGGNQAVAATRAGAETRMVGAVGSDDLGTFILDHLRQVGLSDRFIARHATGGTGMSVAISVETGDYGAVIVSGVNRDLTTEMFADETLWDGAGILALQNEIPEPINVAAAAAARERGLRVCLNAAPARPLPDELVSLIDIIVVNAVEAEAYCGVAVQNLTSADRAAGVLARTYPVAIVTAGSHGLAVAAPNDFAFSVPARNVAVVSTHGAGDVFVGTLCAALAGDNDLHAACATANARAAAHVADPGRHE